MIKAARAEAPNSLLFDYRNWRTQSVPGVRLTFLSASANHAGAFEWPFRGRHRAIAVT